MAAALFLYPVRIFYRGSVKMEMEFVIKGEILAAAGEAASKVKNILRQVGVDSSLLRRTAIVAL